MPTYVVGLVLAAALAGAVAADAADASRQKAGPPKPSANAGKTGTYQCTTSNAQYNYYVCAPAGYSDTKPAGLYLFFHGQSGQSGAPHFGAAKTYFVDRHNIVAINMQYMDGDNMKDTGGKVDAAIQAIKQTMADYRIIPGRGIVASFSGGGLPHAEIFSRFQQGKGSHQELAWPFNHMQLTGSNFRRSASGSAPMSWYIGVGGGEWDMANLGTDGVQRASEVYAMIAKELAYCPDARFKCIKEKGHSIDDRDVQASAELFARTDVFLAPYVYEPGYAERELAQLAAAANARMFARVLKAIDTLVANPRTTEDVRVKARALKELVERRAALCVEQFTAIAARDPILGIYYGKLIVPQLVGMPQARDVQKALSDLGRDRKRMAAYAALTPFANGLGSFFAGGGTLKGAAVPILEEVRKVADDGVLIGLMAGEFLLLK